MHFSIFHDIDYKSDIFTHVTSLIKPLWSWLLNFGSNASSLFAIALIAILQSTLRGIIGRQFVKSNNELSSFCIRVITPHLTL